ncbi:head maturation protease, ClpP-related [Bacillus paranthracis]|uniref:ATP-dependent Clp protease proteolytic subunit n=4 Tax=Bacillus cereus group TaxID=86661 RepID=A0A7D8H5G8_9BACI|nr:MULTISPECIES: head maturation protease, ClpP-related [Bacillus]ACJ81545.1 prophage LambdaBa02, Clp protease family protein [Bacillus cereus AH187]EJR23212.1 ATP-dependent Clp protease, proteolytic subunit ClpP [Bacillus cereus MSX-A12]KMP78731.1 Clp protease ClpP [Bacillus cereus]MCD9100564.1 Clp protease ClpP [Bacillus sp. PLB03]WPH60190.1 head maturation protease [Bacillus phage vB_BanS-A16R4]CKF54061.1 ATP-dependent Clp protease%2C protease subunit [Streptococcus pneumoniae]
MAKNKQNKFFQMKASANGKTADVFIYGEITKYAWEEYGEVSSITFKNELDELGDDIETINLYINSPGGSVFETMAIIAMLQRHQAKVISYIDGIGASCASVLPMISDKIIMYANSMMMIHNAWTYASGNANQLRKAADDIERINQSMVQHYLTRAGDKLDEDTLKQLLDAETWLSAEEAMNYGLCDEIISENNAAACLDEKWMKEYKNVPQQLVNAQANIPSNEMLERQKIAEEAKANADYIKTILGGIHL